MGNSKEEISLKSELSILKNILKEKGYPEKCFLEEKKIKFSYKKLDFEISIPLIIRNNSNTLLIVDYKPQENLSISERGIIALARVLFSPPPYFALITNFRDFVLINVYTQEKERGGKDIIPEFIKLKNYKTEITKSFNPEIEKKILAIYLSGG
ncbi:MAG: type I restriction enzyme HsdR N-terminal domain-containing protein [Thermodesulfobacterium sp.]|nr:type I restriction enzyme HsdR N-terminal domain-containing protein [Thermodesulfobacterium sp.]